jgi:hypothetical protein
MIKNLATVPAMLALAGLVFTIISCDALINPTSLFSDLDAPDTGAIANSTGTELLDSLSGLDGSPTFYDSLSDQEKAKIDAELARLELSDDPSVRSEAALARVELAVKTNSFVTDTINGISDLLVTDDGSDKNTESTGAIVDILTHSLSPIMDNEAALDDFLAQMDLISDSYGNVSGGDVGAGDLQTYMVAAIFSTLVDVHGDSQTAAAALSQFLTNPAADPDMSDLLPPTVTEEEFQELITGTGGKIETLTSLADIAGLPDLGTKITDAVSGEEGTL